MEGCKIKYGDVKDVFNIVDITDKYLLIKDKEIVKKVYIYEVEPVTFLNFSIDVQSNILNLYSEFLHELNFDFQIYISNKKINIHHRKSYRDHLFAIVTLEGEPFDTCEHNLSWLLETG